VAGDQFIFKGGDTWTASDLGVAWSWNGSSGSRIYIGVDQTWFTGGSWVRPIFTCGGTACSSDAGGSHAQFQIFGSYVTLDNIEFTGLKLLSTDSFPVDGVQFAQPGDEVENCYFHGWTRDTGSGGQDVQPIAGYTGGGASQLLGTSVHDDVIDGQDSYNAGTFTGTCIGGGAQFIYQNVCRYAFNGINGLWDQAHDNLVEHIDFDASSGAHCNGIYNKGPIDTTANTMYTFNNVIRDSTAMGCVVDYNSGVECPTCKTYLYGNLIYGWPGVDPPYMTAGADGHNGGTFYFYNDTVETADEPSCVGNGFSGGNTNTSHYANMHCISGGTSPSICVGPGTTCTDDSPGNSLLQTLTAALAAGYCEPGVGGCSATYPYAPSSSGSATVGAGANETSNVATFGTAFGSDTTLAISYNATNHTVSYPYKAAVARPNSAWNIGAYQFSGSTSPPPGPATGLFATVARTSFPEIKLFVVQGQ